MAQYQLEKEDRRDILEDSYRADIDARRRLRRRK
jgi:hypothetical protein